MFLKVHMIYFDKSYHLILLRYKGTEMKLMRLFCVFGEVIGSLQAAILSLTAPNKFLMTATSVKERANLRK